MKKITWTLAILTTTSLMAADGSALFQKCTVCHGIKAEKRALGRSDVIQGWREGKIISELKEFRDEKVDEDAMIMKAQVKGLSDDEIQALAKYITTLK